MLQVGNFLRNLALTVCQWGRQHHHHSKRGLTFTEMSTMRTIKMTINKNLVQFLTKNWKHLALRLPLLGVPRNCACKRHSFKTHFVFVQMRLSCVGQGCPLPWFGDKKEPQLVFLNNFGGVWDYLLKVLAHADGAWWVNTFYCLKCLSFAEKLLTQSQG